MQRQPSLPGRWDSWVFPLASGQRSFTVTHGRGVAPRSVDWELICVTTDGAYLPGDEMNAFSGTSNGNFTKWKNAAQVGLAINNVSDFTSPTFTKKDVSGTFTITLSHWKLRATLTW